MTTPVLRTGAVIEGGVIRCWSHWVWCPGCNDIHGFWTAHPEGVPDGRPLWTWDGNAESPTFEPSLLVMGPPGARCHSFLRAGVWDFLGDSEHDLAGKRVPMVSLPDFLIRESY